MAMKTQILPSGDLLLTADNKSRSDLAYWRRAGYQQAESAVADELRDNYEFVQPETIGALTSAPILCAAYDMDYPDHGEPAPIDDAKIYWFEPYQLIDPWEQLSRRGRVTFNAAK